MQKKKISIKNGNQRSVNEIIFPFNKLIPFFMKQKS